MTKGEEEFIDQMTRKKMVDWCELAVLNGDGIFTEGDCLGDSFVRHALAKKWVALVSKANGEFKILSAGWETAARFLKR